ncbi:MAG: ferritin-like domain-containing protein [Acidobacteriota bacterium]|nr:ferritin-like domain-containing protein [Acidobacteriota bacterium]
MADKSLHDLFIDELRDMFDAEKQLIKALPKLARAASSAKLRGAFESHLNQTRGQVTRLEKVFASINEKPRGKHCDGMAGIIKEGDAVLKEGFDAETLDAALIASGQRAEHYEMAAYGTLVAWARIMGHGEAARLLQLNLNEEGDADQKLSNLADGGVNQKAANKPHFIDASERAAARGGRKGSKKR